MVKVSLELMILAFVVALCSIVSILLLIRALWPLILLAIVIWVIYEHYHPKKKEQQPDNVTNIEDAKK